MQAANRVVFNTVITYARAVITAGIALYSTRVVLNALGAVDFGLYNVIGGMITMLAFLNASMTVTTQRFISYNLGTGNIKNVKKIFANSVIVHVILGLILIVGIEIIGLYLINTKLTIPPERLYAAKVIFHFVTASTLITIVSVPYDSVINAHENMGFLAVVNVIESVFKLLVAILLLYIPGDKLIIYGLLTMLVSFVIRIIKRLYSKSKYQECTVNYRDEYDRSMIVEQIRYSGWNLFGALSYLGRNQGLAVILNLFLGSVVNAAYAISSQINSQIMFFSSVLQQAINPQIIKSEGANERAKMINLSFLASKIGFLLLGIIAIPVIFELRNIVTLWLVNVPDNTVLISQLVLISTMLNQLTIGIDSALHASGNIKRYMLHVGIVKLMIIPISYTLLYFKYSLLEVFLFYAFIEGVAGYFRLRILSEVLGVPINSYCKAVIFKVIPFVLFTTLFDYLLTSSLSGKYRFIITLCFSGIISTFTIYLTALNRDEKNYVLDIFKKLKAKF